MGTAVITVTVTTSTLNNNSKMVKTATVKSAEKRGKTKTRSKHHPQKISKEKVIDDIILLDDEDELPPALETSSLQNVEDSSVSSAQSDNKDEHDCSTDGAKSDIDDEVEVIKANIFKFQGELSYEQEINQDILNFKYYDDFNDEDIVIVEDDVDEMDDSVNDDDDEAFMEEERILVSCDECLKLFDAGDIEEHKQEKHPPKKRSIKHFDSGNFFMIAA